MRGWSDDARYNIKRARMHECTDYFKTAEAGEIMNNGVSIDCVLTIHALSKSTKTVANG
jgi:hypothetical protein